MATERTRTVAQAVVGVAVVVVAVGLGILVLRTAWRSVASLDPQFAAALAVATATIVAVPLTRWFDGRRLREEPLQGRKVEVYERFIRGFLDNFFDNKRGGIQEDKIAAFMFGITPDLTIWASDEVLRRWSVLRRAWANVGDESPDPSRLYELEDLLLAVRADLGHRNKGLEPGDVLGLWVNDIGTWQGRSSNRRSAGEQRGRAA
jgi:hypothetical protein